MHYSPWHTPAICFMVLFFYEAMKFPKEKLAKYESENYAFFRIKIHYGHLWVCANVSLSCSSPFCIFWLIFFRRIFIQVKWMKHSLLLACEGQIMSRCCTGWMDGLPLCASISSKAKHSQACQCVLIQYSNVSWPYISTSVTHTCIQYRYMEMTQHGHWHSVLCSTYHRILPRLLYIVTFYWKAEVMRKASHTQEVVLLQVTASNACEKSGWFISWTILKDIKMFFVHIQGNSLFINFHASWVRCVAKNWRQFKYYHLLGENERLHA